MLNEFYKKYNVTMLLGGNTGCQMGGWFRKEIKTVDDLKGLKFRIGGFPGRVIAKLGGVPQLIGAPDIYPALEKGVIDAAEWVGPYDDEKLGFYKVAKNYYTPGWWEGGSMLNVFINLDKWNALPKNYQAMLEHAAAYANDWMVAKYDQVNPPALRRSDRQRHQVARVLAGDHGSLLEGGAWNCTTTSPRPMQSFKKVYDSMKAYMKPRIRGSTSRNSITIPS